MKAYSYVGRRGRPSVKVRQANFMQSRPSRTTPAVLSGSYAVIDPWFDDDDKPIVSYLDPDAQHALREEVF